MYLSFTRKLFCSRNKLACATYHADIYVNGQILDIASITHSLYITDIVNVTKVTSQTIKVEFGMFQLGSKTVNTNKKGINKVVKSIVASGRSFGESLSINGVNIPLYKSNCITSTGCPTNGGGFGTACTYSRSGTLEELGITPSDQYSVTLHAFQGDYMCYGPSWIYVTFYYE